VARAANLDSLDSWTLRALHLDLLGRPPLSTETERWCGRNTSELLEDMLGSDALWENWLEEQFFYFFLVDNFRPADAEILSLKSELGRGSIGVLQALYRIILSTSFDRRNPGPDTFVTVVMEQILGKNVQTEGKTLEIGKHIYDGSPGNFLGKKGSSQADVVRIAIEDELAVRHFLLREHRRMLRSDPDPKDLMEWTRRLKGDDRAFSPILGEWIDSAAYLCRLSNRQPMPNRVYVRALFIDLVGRLPEGKETQRMRSALDGLSDSGPLRSVIARLLLDSGTAQLPSKEEITDPTAWIGALFERLLGRPASEAELAVFVKSFHDPVCRPETILYAIVSHPQYATW